MLDDSHKAALFFQVQQRLGVGGTSATQGVSTGAAKIRKAGGLSLACGTFSMLELADIQSNTDDNIEQEHMWTYLNNSC